VRKSRESKQEKNAENADDWQGRLERFLSSPLALKAGQGLSERACIALHVGDENFYFRRENGENTLSRAQPEGLSIDVHFWVPLSTLRHLLSLAELPETGIGTMGVAIFERMFLQDKDKKISFRVEAGFLSLWSKGYFSVLKAGGPEVASYLARFGFDSLSRVKELLKKSGF
jgi:hypothetical protein